MLVRKINDLRLKWKILVIVATLSIMLLVPFAKAALRSRAPNPTQSPNDPPCPASAPLVGPPVNKDQCKNDGWKQFNVPRCFKNQGDCVSFVETGK